MDKRITQLKNYINQLDSSKLGLDIIEPTRVKIKEINRGGYNVNYLLTIDGQKFVLRLNLDNYVDTDNQTEYEYRILKHLENRNIAPKVYFIDTTEDKLDYYLLVEEFIENKPLDFGNKFLEDFGVLLKKFHSVELPQGDWLIKNTQPLKNQWDFIKGKIDFIKSKDTNSKFVEFIQTYTSKVDDYIIKYSDLFKPQDICLNHRDLVVENILQTEKGLRLVDWQAVMADDQSHDLAFFTCDMVIEWNLGRCMTKEENQIFLNSYGATDDLIKKIDIKQPMIYLELFVWVAYRVAYLRDKLNQGLVEEVDQDFVQKRIKAYENFLTEEKMTKNLSIF